MERSHRYLEEELGSLAGRLDGFFGDDSRLELDLAGSYVRWRNELRLDDRGRMAARTALRASIELPALSRRLARAALVVSGESTPDPTGHPRDEASSPGYSPTLKAEQAAIELRADLHRQPGTLVQAAVGLRPHWTAPVLEPVARVRFLQRLDAGMGIGVRLAQEISFTGREKGGEKTRLDFDRSLGPHTDLRWVTTGGITEASRGYEVATELSLFHELPRLALGTTLAFSVFGHTNPVSEVDLYRAYLRLRRQLWVPWLFAELEPAIEWPVDPALGRIQLQTITLRLEVHFDGRAPRAEASARGPRAAPGGAGGFR